MLRRQVVASVLLLGLLPAPGLRAAKPERAPSIASWQGAPGCSDGAALEVEVERLLAGSSAAAPLEVHAKVRAIASGYGLVLYTAEAEDARRFQRELSAASCQELLRAGAIVVALAIDPAAANRVLDSEQHSQAQAPAPEDRPHVAAFEPLPQPAASGARVRDEHALPPTTPELPERDDPVGPEPGGSGEGVRLVPFLRGAAVWDSGVLPAPAWGALLAAGISGTSWRADLGVTYLPARRAELERDPAKGGDVELIAGTSSGCWWVAERRLELGLCGGVEAGVVVGQGVGVDRPTSGTIPWLAGRAGGFGAYRIERWLSVELNVGAVVRVGRAQFVLEPLGPIHEPAPLSVRIDLGPRFTLE
jgi:hypothetical protein